MKNELYETFVFLTERTGHFIVTKVNSKCDSTESV